MPKLQFLGAAGTVTGSRFLAFANGKKFLIDCGLFQGGKELEARNCKPFPVNPSEISAIFVTHAHLDHSGYLPKLVQSGFRGKIYATPSTIELLHIMLLDSAHLQEEDSAFHQSKHGCSAEPLYTVQDAMRTLQLLQPIRFNSPTKLDELTATFIPSGHILGAAFIKISVSENGQNTDILFTGDMGRYHSAILKDPTAVSQTDYLLLESTYGDRTHSQTSREEALLPAVQDCAARSACLLIPAFTVGRTQEILYVLRELMLQNKMPKIPIYVDSPMAIDVTHIYENHHDEHDLDLETMEREGHSPFNFPSLHYVRTVAESKTLNKARGPMIIISANGMATGGRIMHHLMRRLPDPSTILLFVGYQAEGSRGKELVDGAKSVEIFHQNISVKAKVMQADTFSAHGDYLEILQWLSGFEKSPKGLYLVHGEAEGREGLRKHILEKFPSWNVLLPNEMETVDLSAMSLRGAS